MNHDSNPRHRLAVQVEQPSLDDLLGPQGDVGGGLLGVGLSSAQPMP